MRNFYYNSKIIEQVLTKEDFSILARIVNSYHNEHNENHEQKENTVHIDEDDHSWVKSLSTVEKDMVENYAIFAEESILLLSTPLLISSTDKIVRKTFLKDKNNIFPTVFYAGVIGLKKGIRKYDDSKDSGKSIHYIVRWFDTYAGRELARSEADALGVPYTRYQLLKKVSAVRIKMASTLKRNPTNEEILDYFHSGKAELRSKNTNNTQKNKKVSKSNSSITINDIIEQERVYDAYFRRSSIINDIQ